MKRISKPASLPSARTKAAGSLSPLLAFGAHPDDIEFGCGAVLAGESLAGRAAHLVVCSRGEAASNGSPAERAREANRAAEILEATIEFLDFGGDAHFEITVARTIALARIIRQVRPSIVLAPTVVENQHPDHRKLGLMVRDAARLARFGGLRELRGLAPHAVGQLFFYAITPESEPRDVTPVLVDVSPAGVRRWTAAMEAHASQMKTRDYLKLQLTRACLQGMRAGVDCAVPLFPGDPVVVRSLTELERGARQF